MDEYQIEFEVNSPETPAPCPACGKEMLIGHKECYSCGVIVERFNSIQHERGVKEKVGGIDHLTLEHIKQLEHQWKKLVVNYHDQKAHEEFLGYCFKRQALPYAVHCYSRMMDIDGDDDIASMMRRRAFTMISAPIEGTATPEKKSIVDSRFPFLKWVNWIGIFFSSFCMVSGMMIPQARNLIGLGASFLVIFIALYIFRRKNPSL
ncbi:MAG: hypothetical protein KDD33_04225 [Bdellovibrionales bacterium]|nr:hypothetical protein [Bdellovibrionales bacterium]